MEDSNKKHAIHQPSLETIWESQEIYCKILKELRFFHDTLVKNQNKILVKLKDCDFQYLEKLTRLFGNICLRAQDASIELSSEFEELNIQLRESNCNTYIFPTIDIYELESIMLQEKCAIILSKLASSNENHFTVPNEDVEETLKSSQNSSSLINIDNCKNIWNVLACCIRYSYRAHKQVTTSLAQLELFSNDLEMEAYKSDTIEASKLDTSKEKYDRLVSETDKSLKELIEVRNKIADTYSDWIGKKKYKSEIRIEK